MIRVADPKPGQKQNLVGRVFENLTVLQENGRNKYKNVLWLCKCICGNETNATTTDLKGRHKISCGCKQYRKGAAVYNWTGHGEISGSYLYQIRKSAETRNLPFNVTPKYLWDLFSKQNRKCALTGLELTNEKINRTASLDRIDSGRGYEVGNVQWVHKDINLMRNAFSTKYFIDMCTRVSLMRYVNLKNNDNTPVRDK
jgi:hypothetical protein